MTMRARFAEVVTEAMAADDRIAVVLADIGVRQFAAAMDRFPERVINVGIREQAMVGVAAGLALEGFRPVVHSYAPFLVERPYEQIKLDFAHQGVGGVFVSIGGSHDAAGEGRTHQAPEDVALMATIPGMAIHAPGHPEEAHTTVLHALADDGLHYIRLVERSNSRAHDGLERLTVIRDGGPGAVTVIAVGTALDAALEGSQRFGATVLYASRIRPFDAVTLRAHATRDVVLVEPVLEGTSTAVVSGALADRPHRLLAIGVANAEHRRYGTSAEHERAHGLDAAGVERSIRVFLQD